MDREKDHKEYNKKCYVCGQFVKKNRWVLKVNPTDRVPMCRTCALNCDDPYNY